MCIAKFDVSPSEIQAPFGRSGAQSVYPSRFKAIGRRVGDAEVVLAVKALGHLLAVAPDAVRGPHRADRRNVVAHPFGGEELLRVLGDHVPREVAPRRGRDVTELQLRPCRSDIARESVVLLAEAR